MFRSLAVKTVRPAAFAGIRPAARVAVMPKRFYSEAKPAANPEATDAPAAGEAAEAAETPAGSELEKKLAEVTAKYEAKDKECAKFKDAYARAIADFRNLQKTTEREIEKSKAFALQKFAKDLVESVDNFDLALEAVAQEKLEGNSGNKDLIEFYQGIKMVQEVFERTLEKHGLTKMNPIGEEFDANLHEATFQVPQPDKKPGTIFHVQRVGFKLNDRVLRAPKVGVVAESE